MAKKSTRKFKWTVMVYLAGDNNLTEESVFSLTEMEKVRADDEIAVVAQFDPRASHIPSHRVVIRGAAHKAARGTSVRGSLGSDAIPIEDPKITFPQERSGAKNRTRNRDDDGETDTANRATLFDFISWTKEHYEAKHYMVILAGHGAGTEENFLLRDDSSRNSLSIPALRDVFENVKNLLKINIDILGMDVCLMSMVEICYELNGLVDYLVASESYSPAAGWPYGQILATLQDRKEESTEDIASNMVKEYIGFYSDYVMGGLSVDQSVLKVSAIEPVADTVEELADTIDGWLTDRVFSDAIILAHWEAQSYNGETFVDLQDFCELLQKRYPKAEEACGKVILAIRALVRKSCFTGIENQFSNGVSIYFPWSEVAPSYFRLKFAKDAGWNDFLYKYVEATRRKARGFDVHAKPLLNFGPDRPREPALVSPESERFRKVEDRKVEDRGAIPIHSMRNPPIDLYEEGLSGCIRANPAFVERLKVFSKIRSPKKRKKPR